MKNSTIFVITLIALMFNTAVSYAQESNVIANYERAHEIVNKFIKQNASDSSFTHVTMQVETSTGEYFEIEAFSYDGRASIEVSAIGSKNFPNYSFSASKYPERGYFRIGASTFKGCPLDEGIRSCGQNPTACYDINNSHGFMRNKIRMRGSIYESEKAMILLERIFTPIEEIIFSEFKQKLITKEYKTH